MKEETELIITTLQTFYFILDTDCSHYICIDFIMQFMRWYVGIQEYSMRPYCSMILKAASVPRRRKSLDKTMAECSARS